MTPFAASVALLRRTDVLLIERARPPSEGLWTLPGGRLEPGETAEQCAIRELREELGLAVYALRSVTVVAFRQHRLQVFATQAFEGDVVADPAEVRDWRWVAAPRVDALRTTPGLVDVVERAMRLFDRT